MSKPLKLYANITDGKINFLSPDWVQQKFNELPDAQYTITIEKYFGQRSNNQNKYYWACVVPMVYDGLVDMGYDEIRSKEDAHELLKNLFLKRKVVNKQTGEVIGEINGSTSDLQTIDFNKYLEQIWQWAAEWLQITIPSPNSQSKLFAI